MTRILHVIDSLGAGGAERNLLQTAAYLAGRGVEQRVVSLYDDDDLAADFTGRGIGVVSLGLLRRFFLLPFALRPLLKAAKKWKPDLISTQLIPSDILGRTAAKRLGIPVISTWQNAPYDAPNLLAHSLRARVALRISRKFDRETSGYACRFIAVSRSVRKSYCCALGIDPVRCDVIPNSVDLSRFPAEKSERAERTGTLRLIHVGRHVLQKGLSTLFRALRVVPESLDVSVDLFGKGPLSTSLEREVRDNGIESRVRFRGTVLDVVPHLLDADAFVFPSVHEGLSLAYVEALAAGLPVIASDVPANKEVDPNSRATLFFPEGDADALGRAITALAETLELRKTLAKRAQALAEPYSHERIGSRYYDLIESLGGRSS